MTDHEKMQRIDQLFSHVWMVRTLLKHSEDAEEDDELREVVRDLYDSMLAVGEAWQNQDAAAYLKQVKKKLGKLKSATQLYGEIQPEISLHTNFKMARQSLEVAVAEVERVMSM